MGLAVAGVVGEAVGVVEGVVEGVAVGRPEGVINMPTVGITVGPLLCAGLRVGGNVNKERFGRPACCVDGLLLDCADGKIAGVAVGVTVGVAVGVTVGLADVAFAVAF